MERSKRRTAQQAAADKRAARQQKADLAAAKAGAGTDGKGEKDTAAGEDRVTLGKAIGDEAYRRAEERLRARRENPEPFLRRDRKDDDADEAEDGAETPETDTDAGKADAAAGAEDAAHGPADASAGAASGSGSPGPDAGPGAGWVPPPRGDRRSADEAMYDATAEDVTVTVEWPDRPTGPARPREPVSAVTTGVRGLPRAPHRPAGRRPGTTRTITTTKGAPVSTPSIRLPNVPGVAAEHMTEVTLDDVLDHLGKSKKQCFTTYDECARLADKAIQLRDALTILSEELRARHNIVGRLTSAAMRRLSESMDLLARKATQMRGESLRAAEAIEVAHDAMHDAYRPVQRAAADAGLHMPSARIHNED